MAAPSRNNQVNARVTTNATSATLASYTPTSGSNRVLVVRAAAMYGTQSSFTLSATFGGVGMTEAVTAVVDWTSRYLRQSIFYLINPSGSAGDIVVTANQTMNGFVVDAMTLLDAAQNAGQLIGITDTDAGTDTDTSSLSLAGCAAESLILAAVASNCALAPTWSWTTLTEDYELTGTASTAEMAGAGAYYATAASGTVSSTVTRSDTTPGLVAAAVEFKKPPAGGLVMPIFDHHYRMMRG